MSVLAPSFAIWPSIRARAPLPSAVVMTTAATPMRMPRMVSPARRRLRKTAMMAMRSAERKVAVMLLVPQRVDGIEPRSALGRQEPENDANRKARRDRQHQGRRGQKHRPTERDGKPVHGPDAEHDAEEPSQHGQGDRLHEELKPHVRFARPDGHAD